jgi:hypothetical protein
LGQVGQLGSCFLVLVWLAKIGVSVDLCANFLVWWCKNSLLPPKPSSFSCATFKKANLVSKFMLLLFFQGMLERNQNIGYARLIFVGMDKRLL